MAKKLKDSAVAFFFQNTSIIKTVNAGTVETCFTALRMYQKCSFNHYTIFLPKLPPKLPLTLVMCSINFY